MADKRIRIMLTTLFEMKAYTLDFFMTLMGFPVFIAVTYLLWKVILENSAMSGVSLAYLVTYYTLVYAVMSIAMDEVIARKISGDVISGRMAVTLVKPISYINYNFWKRVLNFLFNFSLYMIIIAVLNAFFSLEITGSVLMIALFIVSLALAFLMNFAIMFALGTSAFWMEESYGFVASMRTLMVFMAGGWIPLEMLSGSLKEAAFILPFRFTAHFPVSILMGRIPASEVASSFALMIAWTIAFYIIAKLLWKIGEKKFCGYGI